MRYQISSALQDISIQGFLDFSPSFSTSCYICLNLLFLKVLTQKSKFCQGYFFTPNEFQNLYMSWTLGEFSSGLKRNQAFQEQDLSSLFYVVLISFPE